MATLGETHRDDRQAFWSWSSAGSTTVNIGDICSEPIDNLQRGTSDSRTSFVIYNQRHSSEEGGLRSRHSCSRPEHVSLLHPHSMQPLPPPIPKVFLHWYAKLIREFDWIQISEMVV